MSPIETKRILNMQLNAIADGDDYLESICSAALRGDVAEQKRCLRLIAIADARRVLRAGVSS